MAASMTHATGAHFAPVLFTLMISAFRESCPKPEAKASKMQKLTRYQIVTWAFET